MYLNPKKFMFQSSPMVKTIFYINVVVFLFTLLGTAFGIPVIDYGALYPLSSPNFHVYQFLTSMFLHGGWMHIIFNMLAFLSLGPHVENQYGERKFLTYYLIMGLGAAFAQLAFSTGAMIGASGAIFGVLMIFAFQNPDAEVSPFGISFLSAKMKYWAAIFVAIEVVSIIFSFDKGIGHWAHLGGAATGVVLYFLDKKFNFDF